MIARDSKSYPYLAIAQYYEVPYEEVLKYSEEVTSGFAYPTFGARWRQAVIELEMMQCNIK